MLALQKVYPREGLILRDVEKPALADEEVLIRVKAVGICGSDLHLATWTPAYEFMSNSLPVTIGHEFSGTVAALGRGVQGIELGQRVVVVPSVVCGECERCAAGERDACLRRKAIGLTRAGAFAEWVAVPAGNCLRIPDSLSFELAALAEPLTIAAQAVARGEITRGSRVLVMGPGTIGQGIAMMARRAGATPVAVSGRNDVARFAVLRGAGFEHLIDIDDADALERIRKLARGGFDVIFEASGASGSIARGLPLLRNGGILVIVGIQSGAAQFDVADVVRRSLQLRGSYRAPRALWTRVIDMLALHPDEFLGMISHRLPLERVFEGFALGATRQASKIMILSRDD